MNNNQLIIFFILFKIKMMMYIILEKEKANKPRRKIKKDLSKSDVFGN